MAIEAQTCIRFVRYDSRIHTDYIEIINAGAGQCWSFVGRLGGRQELSLGEGCLASGILMHEAIHALGYDHMHNHADRDLFVDIMIDNVEVNMQHNFDKVNLVDSSNFDTPYDYNSIMHYDRTAFSKNGQDTMIPKDSSFLDIIGQHKLSPGDIQRLNNMYPKYCGSLSK